MGDALLENDLSRGETALVFNGVVIIVVGSVLHPAGGSLIIRYFFDSGDAVEYLIREIVFNGNRQLPDGSAVVEGLRSQLHNGVIHKGVRYGYAVSEALLSDGKNSAFNGNAFEGKIVSPAAVSPVHRVYPGGVEGLAVCVADLIHNASVLVANEIHCRLNAVHDPGRIVIALVKNEVYQHKIVCRAHVHLRFGLYIADQSADIRGGYIALEFLLSHCRAFRICAVRVLCYQILFCLVSIQKNCELRKVGNTAANLKKDLKLIAHAGKAAKVLFCDLIDTDVILSAESPCRKIQNELKGGAVVINVAVITENIRYEHLVGSSGFFARVCITRRGVELKLHIGVLAVGGVKGDITAVAFVSPAFHRHHRYEVTVVVEIIDICESVVCFKAHCGAGKGIGGNRAF